MVVVKVHMLAGRTAEQKRDVIAGITSMVTETLKVPVSAVRVLLIEIARDAWGIDGRPASEVRPAPPAP